MKAVLSAFGREFCIAVTLNCVAAAFQLSSPFIVKRLIDFIAAADDPDVVQNTMDGIWLVMLLISTQLIAYMMSEHLVLY